MAWKTFGFAAARIQLNYSKACIYVVTFSTSWSDLEFSGGCDDSLFISMLLIISFIDSHKHVVQQLVIWHHNLLANTLPIHEIMLWPSTLQEQECSFQVMCILIK